MLNTATTGMLTDDHKQQYERDGYTVVRGLVPRQLMDAVRQELLRIETGEHDWPVSHFQYVDPDRLLAPSGKPLPLGVQLPARHSETFRAVADHAGLQQAMELLLGGPVVRHTDQALIKSRYIQTEQAGRTYYHQDSYYWKIQPRLGCNAWIPTDDVGPGAIALGILPGTQRDWTLVEHEHYYDDPPMTNPHSKQPFKRHRIPEQMIDYSKELIISAQPGDAIFFSNYTWHRAEPNTSGQTKCAYAIAYKLDQATP